MATRSQDCNFHHIPVLFEECMDGLAIKADGIYVDCTAGGGGHSAGIVERLGDQGLLISLDKDDEALRACERRREELGAGDKWVLKKTDFSRIGEVLKEMNIEKVDGVLADLGVSSHQIDTDERGFSYMKDGPLDMRMNRQQELSAEVVVNEYSEGDLTRIFRDYGEERYAGRIASVIVKKRAEAPIRTTTALADIIRSAMPHAARKEDQHPARRCFQAIRIEVNHELDSVSGLLETVPALLKPHGRFAVISFHSLEDRLVKEAFRKLENPCTCPREFPVCVCGKKPMGKQIHSKPIVASKKEAMENKRSGCAKLRVFERNEEVWLLQ
ncbi:MAG: 16S rRNA (cytosine(1402)-N(4))-methyltransferase RsmH [Clostridiales bacterium]|nr:16S rRNA (cytosine(1402)-N(4))-methyltransferase RsmH [Clostridiales bacterium]